MTYALQWSEEAAADILGVPAFHRRRIIGAIESLRHEPTVETRSRKPLAEPLAELPEGTWQLRCSDYRALYKLEGENTIRIFRIILKGTRTTADALGRGRKP